MNEEARQRILRKHHDELSEWIATVTNASDRSEHDIEVEFRRNYLDSVRRFDSRLAYAEELVVRLMGDAARTGLLDLELAPVLEGIKRIFSDSGHVDIGLAGIASGSTVLKLRPLSSSPSFAGDLVLEDESVPVDATAADEVGRTLIKLVSATEQADDLRPWGSYLSGLETLAETLDSHDLDADFSWSSSAGSIAHARLTGAGRAHLRSIRVRRTDSEERPISGRITELRESGLIKVKTGLGARSPSYEVHIDKDELLNLQLTLGQSVGMIVEESVERDRLGREQRRRVQFVRFSSNEAPMQLGENSD